MGLSIWLNQSWSFKHSLSKRYLVGQLFVPLVNTANREIQRTTATISTKPTFVVPELCRLHHPTVPVLPGVSGTKMKSSHQGPDSIKAQEDQGQHR